VTFTRTPIRFDLRDQSNPTKMSAEEPQVAEVMTGSAGMQGVDSGNQATDSAPIGDLPTTFSEGVASVGLPLPVVGEFVPGQQQHRHHHHHQQQHQLDEAPASITTAGFQGETDGNLLPHVIQQPPPARLSSDAFGENYTDTDCGQNQGMRYLGVPTAAAASGASPMEYQATNNATRIRHGHHHHHHHHHQHEQQQAAPDHKRRHNSQEDEEGSYHDQHKITGKRIEADHLNRVPSDEAIICDSSGGGGVLTFGGAATVNNNNNNNDNDTEQQQQQQDAPTDADIIAYENAILMEEVRDRPLVGEREPLSALEEEYAAGAGVFLTKIAALKSSYGAIRRTRGDGNCFYRAFLFAYLENLILEINETERDRMVRNLQFLETSLKEAGYDEIVIETPMDTLVGMLQRVASPIDPLSVETLEENIRAEDVSNYIVFLLRMITAAEVRRRADFFAPFILGLNDMDPEEFCRKCVDPMGEEADHVHLVALTDALQVPIRVVYLDRSLNIGDGMAGGGGGGGGREDSSAGDTGGRGESNTSGSGTATVKVDMHDFIPELCIPGSVPRVHVLYRPGHYDILYSIGG